MSTSVCNYFKCDFCGAEVKAPLPASWATLLFVQERSLHACNECKGNVIRVCSVIGISDFERVYANISGKYGS